VRLNKDGTVGAKVGGEVVFRVPDLRDMFAMAALTGILAHGDATISTTESICYKIADAMLEAREK
jgi:hypothetical protein